MSTTEQSKYHLKSTGPATSQLLWGDKTGKPITVIGTDAIRNSFDEKTLQQAINARSCPGVTDVIVNPDAHVGYGAPIGCVLTSPTHIYPGPVGVDIKCSMSLLQLDLDSEAIADRKLRRALLDAITERTPTGPGQGQRDVKKSRRISKQTAIKAVTEGASKEVCEILSIPDSWPSRCEDSFHGGHSGTSDGLLERFDTIIKTNVFKHLDEKLSQLGSYGGGNHFGECEIVELEKNESSLKTASVFGLLDNKVAFLSHCGSRGFGNILATNQFKVLREHFENNNIPLPANDRELVYAPIDTKEANAYLDDMSLGANFATVNHLLINSLVLEAFQEVIPGVKGNFVYFISHNITRKEIFNNRATWVHRKGATRAFPANHAGLAGTPFAKTGHPILLPGNPVSGSVVMVAEEGASKSCYSVNHGAGRQMSRKAAFRDLDQVVIDREFKSSDILTNCRTYPKDEAPAAYKDFNEVVRSVELAGLASTVARLKATFVIKDSSGADD
jgi:tRNA-splicing ligase RtcB